MSDYLSNLLIRTRHPERTIQPYVSSMFDPVLPGSLDGEVGERLTGDDSYPGVRMNRSVPRHDQSAPLAPEVPGQEGENDRLSLERETRQREGVSISTIDNERLHSFSKAAPVSGLKDIDLETNSASSLAELSLRRSDERGSTSGIPSVDNEVGLSPIDRSIVTGSSPERSLGQGSEEIASRSKSTAEPMIPTLRFPRDEGNRAERDEASPAIGGVPSENGRVPLVIPESQTHDREESNLVSGRVTQFGVSSSRFPLVEERIVRGDGEHRPAHRAVGAVSEPKRSAAMLRNGVADETLYRGELSLDPSLEAPVSATAVGDISRQPDVTQEALSSTVNRQEQMASSLAVPMVSKKILAVRRSVLPMTGASVDQVSATDKGKPTEPVVQVTIGRVEVRAMVSPVRQERNHKPQSAMSLDDYLKRRGGRSGG